jgi:hypothetical protein
MHFLRKAEALEFVHQRRALFDADPTGNPYAGSAWTLHFIEQIAEDGWTFAIAEEAQHTSHGSLMLLYSEPGQGDRWQAVTNYYASLYAPLISTAPDRAGAMSRLVDQVAAHRPRCAVVNVQPMDDSGAETLALQAAFAHKGWYVRPFTCFGNWYLPCEGLSFDAFMQGRDSKMLNTWNRKAKKFKEGATSGGRLQIVSDPADVSAAMDAYDHIYAKSWKKPEPYPTFVRKWAEVCAANGWLRLGIAWVNDVPIAAQFWFTIDRRAHIFKLAYDEEFSKWSAGTVLSAHMFRHSLDVDQVAEIDYLTGDDAYKKSWMTHRRERIGVIACNPRTLRGLMAAAKEFVGAARQRWKAKTTVPSTVPTTVP